MQCTMQCNAAQEMMVLLKVQQLERHLGGGDGDDRRVAALRTLVTTQVGPL